MNELSLRLRHCFLGLSIAIFGYLLIAISFGIPPMGEWFHWWVEQTIAQWPGSHLILNPNNILITAPSGLIAMIFGLGIFKKSITGLD